MMRNRWMWFVALATVLAPPQGLLAAPPAPPPAPSKVVATDHPNDKGDKIDVAWELSPDDKPEAAAAPDAADGTKAPDGKGADSAKPAPTPRTVFGYLIERSPPGKDEWVTVGKVEYGEKKFVDGHARRGVEYVYRVAALGPVEGGEPVRSAFTVAAEPAAARMQFFDFNRGWFFLLLLVICSAVVAFILLARAGWPMKVRRIAGLDVVDEAVGRATEMGRPCLFIPGIQDMNEIETVAGITVLARVAKTAAEYDATVEVPTSRSLVMTAARETVQASYLSAGRPDAYNESRIYYVTDEQFGFVAHLTGLMVREKPAACFYMGSFYAESLMLAETGNSIGAIQIAGSAQPAQLPFFVAACDYTLIGEEFFAASAYLSGEPTQLGSLKGQDCGKLIVAALLLVGCCLATLVSFNTGPGGKPEGRIVQAQDYFMDRMLSAEGKQK